MPAASRYGSGITASVRASQGSFMYRLRPSSPAPMKPDASQANALHASLNRGSSQGFSLPQLGDQAPKQEVERKHRSNEPTTRTRKSPAQRRLDRLEWLCFDDRCNRLDALSCSSTLVSFFTRVQVSWADISPSCSHLMLDNSAGDIKGRRGFST